MEIREAVTMELIDIEVAIIEANHTLTSKAVMFKEDILAQKNIQKALVEILKAQKHLKG